MVYANNPSISDQLASSLQRFPQLSFSTVDIAVLVIIASLAVTLAYKFQRGLRPGIRLERALQMLENLMKRNLVLEAQVAELKIEKSHGPIVTSPPPIIAPSSGEPRPGSWEKAFRTPLEAGPPLTARASGAIGGEIPFGKESGIPPPRIEQKSESITPAMARTPLVVGEKSSDMRSQPPTFVSEKITDRPSFPSPPTTASTNWEASPQFLGESKGILTPSRLPRKVPSVSESGGLRQPYIPSPAPKMTASSVIVGPMSSPTPPRISLSQAQKTLTRPSARPAQSKPPIIASPTPPIDSTKPASSLEVSPPPPLISPPISIVSKGDNPTKTDDSLSKPSEQQDKPDSRTDSRPSQITKKKSSTERPSETQDQP